MEPLSTDPPDRAPHPDADDEPRFRAAFEAYYQPLFAYALSRLGDRAAADDVVAEVYATAWRRIAVLPDEPETRLWLFGVARNTIRNSRRSGRRGLRLVERLRKEPHDDVPAPDIVGDPALAQALAELSNDDRELLLLIAWDGFTPTEAAGLLDISPNAARIRLHRARQRLTAALGSPDADQSQDRKCSSPAGHVQAPTTAHEQEGTS